MSRDMAQAPLATSRDMENGGWRRRATSPQGLGHIASDIAKPCFHIARHRHLAVTVAIFMLPITKESLCGGAVGGAATCLNYSKTKVLFRRFVYQMSSKIPSETLLG